MVLVDVHLIFKNRQSKEILENKTREILRMIRGGGVGGVGGRCRMTTGGGGGGAGACRSLIMMGAGSGAGGGSRKRTLICCL